MTSSTLANTLPYGVAPPAYRLPDATRLGRVRLQVADVARSLAFYEGVLGLRVLESGEGRAVLGAGSPLVELVERPGARAVPARGVLGLYHYALLLPDRAALARFVRHLGETGVTAGMSDHLVSEAVYLTDPDGLGIEVYADRPREAWRHEDRQLVIATNPLDVRSLLLAAGEARWNGAPDATVLGHVHVHVGDIAQAAAFYHEALGFDRVVWSYPGALFLSAGGYHHHVGTNTWAAGAAAATDDDARLLDWEVIVPTAGDAEAAAGSLEGAGYAVTRSGRGRLAADPWGTTVRILTAAEAA